MAEWVLVAIGLLWSCHPRGTRRVHHPAGLAVRRRAGGFVMTCPAPDHAHAAGRLAGGADRLGHGERSHHVGFRIAPRLRAGDPAAWSPACRGHEFRCWLPVQPAGRPRLRAIDVCRHVRARPAMPRQRATAGVCPLVRPLRRWCGWAGAARGRTPGTRTTRPRCQAGSNPSASCATASALKSRGARTPERPRGSWHKITRCVEAHLVATPQGRKATRCFSHTHIIRRSWPPERPQTIS